jgi:hypothetical protein
MATRDRTGLPTVHARAVAQLALIVPAPTEGLTARREPAREQGLDDDLMERRDVHDLDGFRRARGRRSGRAAGHDVVDAELAV